MSCLTLTCITGKILLKFGLIKARLSSFRLFSAHLSLVILAHFGSFWAQIGSFWIYLGSIELLGLLRSSRFIQDVSGLFRLIWALFCPFRLINAHLSSFWLNYLYWVLFKSVRLIKAHLSSFRLIRADLDSVRLIQAHLSLFRLFWFHSGSFSLI